MVFSPRARAACSASEHVGRLAARRDPERDVAGLPERLDLPHEHLLERVVVRDARQDARVRPSARSPAAPARSFWNRPTSSADRCCASAALPPLPNTSSFRPPFSASAIACAATSVGPRFCAHPFVQRDRRREHGVGQPRMIAGRHRLVSPRPIAIGLQVRRELLRRQLERLVHLRRHLDLHRDSPCAPDALPSRPASGCAAGPGWPSNWIPNRS